MTALLPESIFNTAKTDYEKPSLFLGQTPGLFDTIHKNYPKIWSLYKGMKSLDWDENEFNYSACASDFVTAPKSKVDKMIKSLAWQWEADSVASRAIGPIISLFDPCPELWAAWQRVSDSEVTHAATYSEIVRMSFPNGNEVLHEILEITEAMQRLSTVAREMAWVRERGLKYQLGLVENDQETYNAIFMFVFLLFVLERVQFMASFAVTFALGQEDLFTQVAKGVQKIATDEYEIHVELDREVLAHELTTERGKEAYKQLKPRMEAVLNEVIASELKWTKFLFEDGESLDYLTHAQLIQWVYFSATNVAVPLGLSMDTPKVESNPLHYMKTWLNISDFQASPQSEANGQYKVNLLQRDDDDVEFAINF